MMVVDSDVEMPSESWLGSTVSEVAMARKDRIIPNTVPPTPARIDTGMIAAEINRIRRQRSSRDAAMPAAGFGVAYGFELFILSDERFG